MTAPQAIAWNLPTSPRKETDPREFEGIGDDPDATVQAEAVPPDVMSALLYRAFSQRFPAETLIETERQEERARRTLAAGFDRLLLTGPSGEARP